MEIPNFLIRTETDSHISFIPEDDDGYIEYKLRLDTKKKFGLEKLYSQMNWRLEEGQSLLGKKEAHYLLGVKDNGELGGLTYTEINKTFDIFELIVLKCNATISQKIERTYEMGSIIYTIVSKKEQLKFEELNVCFVGPCQHGKTTTIGNLVYSCLDNDGYTRSLIFKHEHEKLTGNTSSVKKEILGISANKIINYASCIKGEWGDIVSMSDRIINLIDLPGHLKYLKTTLFGLECYDLDAICIVVDKKKQNENDTFIIELFKNYALLLNIKYKIVLISEDELTLENDEIVISNKIKGGLNQLENFLCNLSAKENKLVDSEESLLFSIIEKYNIQDSGIIFSGIVKYGNLEIGQPVILTNGKDHCETIVTSIHKKQIDSQKLFQKETGAIMLNMNISSLININKFTIISNKIHQLISTVKFKLLWSHDQNINLIKQQSLLFVDNNVIQICQLECVDEENKLFYLTFDIPDIIPILDYKQIVICFLKNINGVFIGSIELNN